MRERSTDRRFKQGSDKQSPLEHLVFGNGKLSTGGDKVESGEPVITGDEVFVCKNCFSQHSRKIHLLLERLQIFQKAVSKKEH